MLKHVNNTCSSRMQYERRLVSVFNKHIHVKPGIEHYDECQDHLRMLFRSFLMEVTYKACIWNLSFLSASAMSETNVAIISLF